MKLSDFFTKYRSYLYVLLSFLCLTPWVSPPIALLTGLIFALTLGSAFPVFNKKASKYLLQISIVGLGFGMNLQDSLRSGAEGIYFTICSVVAVMLVGVLLGRFLKVEEKTAYLISSGTAICGGSAIAATAPLAKANDAEISVSLAIVFMLNALALFIFPVLGHYLNLSEQEFGTWAAIAIHDTSSVVGAGAAYGEEALQVATTVKLTRALWIIPLSLFTAFFFKTKSEKLHIPWFILFFVLAMVISSYADIPKEVTKSLTSVARQALTLTLFFIGAGLSRQAIKSVGFRPFIQGFLLWVFIGIISFCFVCFF